MASSSKKYGLLAWLGSGMYALLLWLMACNLGMSLAAYGFSPLIWLGTLVAVLHLAWAGSAAIAPAMVGLLALMWFATLTDALPQAMHHAISQIWAALLLKLWVQSTLSIVMVAFARRGLNSWRLGRIPSFGFVVGLCWSGLGTGFHVYHFTTGYPH
ncbi:hypothetical protein [Altericista sp. CCNU0014]|uniref:hypothetical protein n=1 Tax=Altericista sp. CCNU0014 TaxID=3082949 RepID=UPI00384D3332